MTELERRALMGDREAQRQCTEQGIVLPCPFCGNDSPIYDTSIGDYDFGWGGFRCYDCELGQGYNFKTREEALSKWNTRPAPPVGRCKECQHYVAEWVGDGETIPAECIHPLTGLFVVNDDDFCSCFEPKGDEAQSCKS